MEYRTPDGTEKHLGEFGKSTQKEFDEAITVLPELIKLARNGNEESGQTANSLLWALANEGFVRDFKDFVTVWKFGNKESN